MKERDGSLCPPPLSTKESPPCSGKGKRNQLAPTDTTGLFNPIKQQGDVKQPEVSDEKFEWNEIPKHAEEKREWKDTPKYAEVGKSQPEYTEEKRERKGTLVLKPGKLVW